MIRRNSPCRITRDIIISDQLAFRNGESVIVEGVAPNPQRPEYKYVVLSQALQKRFRLSDVDLEEVIKQTPVANRQPGYPPAPPPGLPEQKSGKLKWVVLAVGIIVVIVIIAAVASGGKNTSTSTPAQTSTSTPAQTSTSTPAQTSTSTPAQTSVPASPVPASPSEADRVRAWNSQYGSIVKTLAGDINTLRTDAENYQGGSTATILSDAQKCKDDIATARSYPAIPSAQASADFSAALSALTASAQDATDGLNNNDSSLIQRADNEMNQGSTYIQNTTDDINKVMGQ